MDPLNRIENHVKIPPPHPFVVNGDMSYRDQNCLLFQAPNMFISALKQI